MESMRFLIVTSVAGTEEAIRARVRNHQPESAIFCAGSAQQAETALEEKAPEAAIICAPLPDDDGFQLARRLRKQGCAGVLLLLPPDRAERARRQSAQMSVLTLPLMAGADMLDNCICALCILAENARCMDAERNWMQSRLEQEKTISRAKLLLISQHRMTEPEAQHYIERAAMNTCCTKAVAARRIIMSSR